VCLSSYLQVRRCIGSGSNRAGCPLRNHGIIDAPREPLCQLLSPVGGVKVAGYNVLAHDDLVLRVISNYQHSWHLSVLSWGAPPSTRPGLGLCGVRGTRSPPVPGYPTIISLCARWTNKGTQYAGFLRSLKRTGIPSAAAGLSRNAHRENPKEQTRRQKKLREASEEAEEAEEAEEEAEHH